MSLLLWQPYMGIFWLDVAYNWTLQDNWLSPPLILLSWNIQMLEGIGAEGLAGIAYLVHCQEITLPRMEPTLIPSNGYSLPSKRSWMHNK